MSRSKSTLNNPELLGADEPIPDGVRQVKRTTIEQFTQPLRDGDQGAGDVGDDEATNEFAAELGEHDDDPFREEPPLSPMDRLLLDLKERSTNGGQVVVYAKRKPDPVGMSFRNPCNAEKTVGEVPYDENDLSIEALELAIQKLYGGGRYQIIVRQNGDYKGAVTRIIADPVEPPEAAAAPTPSVAQPQSAASAKSPLDEVRDSVAIVREVATLMNTGRTDTARALPPPAPTPNPLETVRETLNLVKEVNGLASIGGNHNGGGGDMSAVRDWTEGIASIARELGLGQVINNLLIFGLRAADRKQQADQESADKNGGQPKAQAEPPKEPSVPLPPFPTLQTAPAPPPPPPATGLPGGIDLAQLPPPIRHALDQTLSTLVAELQANETSPAAEYETDTTTEALTKFIQQFPAAAPIFDQFMQLSSVRLVLALSTLKPEWAKLPELGCAAGFLDEIKEWWAEETEGATNGDQGVQIENEVTTPAVTAAATERQPA